ncbi:MAG TPA: hypothetical protein VFE62_01455 [Gemmataceae bacterium]|nr:hypothetical protein [Pirellulales bacterium]HZZ77152.1 hypothetical protein [Gemmataceae bacterium]
MPRQMDARKRMLRFHSYQAVETYVLAKHKEGVLLDDELTDVLAEFSKTVVSAGEKWEPDDPAFLAVLTQAAFCMKKRLLELHPELADEVRNLGHDITLH